MSQNMRAVGSISPRHGRIWKVVGSGWASTSASNARVSPSMEDPSKPSPSPKAPSTSAGAMATDLSVPMTSVNQSRTNLMPRSSMVRSTKSRCLSTTLVLPGVGPQGPRICVTRLVAMPKVRLALAQTNPVVGAFEENSQAIVEYTRRAAEAGADLAVFGEMVLSGYPIEDLATRPSFLGHSRTMLERLAKRLQEQGLGDLPIIVGFPDGPFEPRLNGSGN